MDARIEGARDRRKPIPRFCSCRYESKRLRYGPYRIPSPASCDVEHARYYGDDIEHLGAIEVEDELGALVRRLAFLSPERSPVYHEWLLFRRQSLLDHRRRLDGPPPELPDDDAVPKVRVVVVEVE
jgi:hypothetical protein